MHTHVNTHIHTYTYTHTYIHTYTHTHIHTYACASVYICRCLSACCSFDNDSLSWCNFPEITSSADPSCAPAVGPEVIVRFSSSFSLAWAWTCTRKTIKKHDHRLPCRQSLEHLCSQMSPESESHTSLFCDDFWNPVFRCGL